MSPLVRYKVMIIDDNPGDADLTRDVLEEVAADVAVEVAVDGIAALEVLEGRSTDERPDLILLDLNLPRRHGLEVLQALKLDAALRSIPVVVLTSSDAPRDVAASYALGAACCVTKPTGLGAFQATVRSVADFWFKVVKLP